MLLIQHMAITSLKTTKAPVGAFVFTASSAYSPAAGAAAETAGAAADTTG